MTFINHGNNLCLVTLHFPTTSASGSVDYYCKSQETAIQKAKEALEKCKDNFDDKSKKEKDLKTLQSQYDEHIAKDHPLEESTRQTKIAEVKKQQKFVTEFQNNFNNALDSKILTNLCSGLETFLGFNKESKGYDGSGIVYSDLDRLCDGVMAFLLGVLEGVKDDDAVKTYDVHQYISKLPDKIRANIHQSPSRFIDTINAVSGALATWHSEVTGRTDNVQTAFKHIIDKHFINDNGFHNALNDLNSIHDPDHLDQVATKLEACFNEAHNLRKVFKTAEEAYSHLDPALKRKLNEPVRKVELQVEKFVAAATNTELREVLLQSEWELKELTKKVNDEIMNRMNKLGNDINHEFFVQIRQPIENVKQKLEESKVHLEAWIKKAESAVRLAKEKCEEIVKKLNGRDSEKDAGTKGGVKKAAEDLQSRAEELLGKAYAAKMEIKQQVATALAQVQVLDRAVRTGLKNTRDGIETKMNDYVKNKLLRYIKEAIMSIGGKGADDGLQVIKSKMQEYAAKFKSEGPGGFGGIVQEWVISIFKKEPVNGWIGKYFRKVDEFNAPFNEWKQTGDNTQITKTIAGIIMAKLNKEIEAAVEVAKRVTPNTSMNDHIRAVQLGCDTFATALGEKLKNDSTDVLIAIGKAINNAARGTEQFPNTLELTKAVEAMLHQLIGVANKAGEGIQSFIMDNTNMSANVDNALSLATNLMRDIETATTGSSPSVKAIPPDGGFTPTEKVEGRILGIVENEVGTIHVGALPDKFKPSNKNFSEYFDSVAENTVGKQELIGNEGKLPQVIKAIETTITDEGSYLGNVTHDTDETPDPGAKDGFYKNTFEKLLTTVDANLTIFTKAVEELVRKENRGIGVLRDSVNDYLLDLEGMIKETGEHRLTAVGLRDTDAQVYGLTKIKTDIEKILGVLSGFKLNNTHNLKNILENAGKFYDEVIVKHTTETIDSIKGYVTSEVTAATRAVQREAKTRYHTKINEMFNKVQLSVTARIAEIDGIIADDLRTGTKGLLKHMQGGIDTAGVARTDKLDALKYAVRSTSRYDSEKFRDLSKALLNYLFPTLEFIKRESMTRIPGHEARKNETSEMVSELRNKLDDLLRHLQKNDSRHSNYDNTFSDLLHSLENTLTNFGLSSLSSTLDPQALPDAGRPVLRALREGMLGFVGELGKAYISKYSMETFKEKLITTKDKKDITLTEYGRKCAKVCLSIVPIVTNSLNDLKENLEKEDGKWKQYKIYNSGESHHSLHRLFFTEHGYDPGLAVNAKHGELNHRTECTGERILGHLTGGNKALINVKSSRIADATLSLDGDEAPTVDHVVERGVIFDLFSQLVQYYKVGHLAHVDKPRTPCNVYEMLVWLTGLPHHQVYGKLEDYIRKCCVKPEKLKDWEYNKLQDNELKLEQTSMVTAEVILKTVENVCTNAPTLLTTILGTGDELTVYASDFSNNALRFTYPASGEDCLHTFLEILRRLWYVLRYLEGQCGHPSSIYGWRDCQYGKSVDHSNWQCEDHPRKQPKCQANCKPTCQPNCQPTCQPNTQANCQAASPLMSYFNDCLPGHLPHRLESIGCKSECKTCSPKSKGQPCLTPLGFRAFSGSTKTGKVLCKILDKILNSDDVSCLFALAQSPPATLAEHFGFTLSLVKGWHESLKTKQHNGFQSVFVESIDKQSISLYKETGTLTDALRNAYGHSQSKHESKKHNEKPVDGKGDEVKKGDLSSLSMVVPCSDQHCGPYLSPLCNDTYRQLLRKNSDTYLSWSVYLPWTFWDLLNSLYNSLCAISCQDWGCKTCMQGDACRRGKHGDSQSACKCPSLVACRGVSPTLYSYGFRFGVPWLLGDKTTKKTCFDIQKQLQNVLQSQYFDNLFKQCDEFLFTIRAPFIWLNVALWLLSLFYLLHIMVIRLDLLHIKSHLHSPSSHRIAAQSLLAAARVNKLNRVFYLQP